MFSTVHHTLYCIFGNGSTASYYLKNPIAKPVTLRNVQVTLLGTNAGAETVTVYESSGSTTLGAIAIAAGAAGTTETSWTADATNGDHVVAAAEVFKITLSDASAATPCYVTLELDPYCKAN